jgi:hypothetical protein
MSQETINQEDVECTLMVGYEYIRGILAYIRVAFYLYRKQQDITKKD